MTRWTKTSDRTDRIIDPFPGMDEKTSCSVLSRKGTGVWNRVFKKRGKIFKGTLLSEDTDFFVITPN